MNSLTVQGQGVREPGLEQRLAGPQDLSWFYKARPLTGQVGPTSITDLDLNHVVRILDIFREEEKMETTQTGGGRGGSGTAQG